MEKPITRRDFLKNLGITGAALALPVPAFSKERPSEKEKNPKLEEYEKQIENDVAGFFESFDWKGSDNLTEKQKENLVDLAFKKDSIESFKNIDNPKFNLDKEKRTQIVVNHFEDPKIQITKRNKEKFEHILEDNVNTELKLKNKVLEEISNIFIAKFDYFYSSKKINKNGRSLSVTFIYENMPWVFDRQDNSIPGTGEKSLEIILNSNTKDSHGRKEYADILFLFSFHHPKVVLKNLDKLKNVLNDWEYELTIARLMKNSPDECYENIQCLNKTVERRQQFVSFCSMFLERELWKENKEVFDVLEKYLSKSEMQNCIERLNPLPHPSIPSYKQALFFKNLNSIASYFDKNALGQILEDSLMGVKRNPYNIIEYLDIIIPFLKNNRYSINSEEEESNKEHDKEKNSREDQSEFLQMFTEYVSRSKDDRENKEFSNFDIKGIIFNAIDDYPVEIIKNKEKIITHLGEDFYNKLEPRLPEITPKDESQAQNFLQKKIRDEDFPIKETYFDKMIALINYERRLKNYNTDHVTYLGKLPAHIFLKEIFFSESFQKIIQEKMTEGMTYMDAISIAKAVYRNVGVQEDKNEYGKEADRLLDILKANWDWEIIGPDTKFIGIWGERERDIKEEFTQEYFLRLYDEASGKKENIALKVQGLDIKEGENLNLGRIDQAISNVRKPTTIFISAHGDWDKIDLASGDWAIHHLLSYDVDRLADSMQKAGEENIKKMSFLTISCLNYNFREKLYAILEERGIKARPKAFITLSNSNRLTRAGVYSALLKQLKHQITYSDTNNITIRDLLRNQGVKWQLNDPSFSIDGVEVAAGGGYVDDDDLVV